MPGHDRSRIVGFPEDQLQEFTCGICCALLDKPVFTACCRQLYCKECIDEWLKASKSCPNDRQTLTANRLIQPPRVGPRLVVNVIEGMNMQCIFKDKGCPSVHSLAEDRQHTECCQYGKCKACGFADPTDELNKLMARVLELENTNKELVAKEYSLRVRNAVLEDELRMAKEREEVHKRQVSQLSYQIRELKNRYQLRIPLSLTTEIELDLSSGS